MRTGTPRHLHPYIQDFVVSFTDQNPTYLDIEVADGCQPGECFENVRRHVDRNGGSAQFGWLIWEWPGALIEAEFHAVWRNEDDVLIDITPAPDGDQRILFAPDNARKYEGKRVNNERMPLNSSRVVHDLIRLCNADFVFFGQIATGTQLSGITAALYQETHRARACISEVMRHGFNRNSSCACGSGKKYKHCHEVIIDDLTEALNQGELIISEGS